MSSDKSTLSIRHREKVLAICERRAIDVTRTPGGAWRFYGSGVDMTVTDLRFVYSEDLKTNRPVYRGRR